MAIDVLQAAKHLCMMSEWRLTNLQVQKILYICNLFFLGKKNEPLVEGDFQAWDRGPVHYNLYHYLKYYGKEPVPKIFFVDVEDIDSSHELEIKIIEDGAKKFSNVHGQILVDITHWEGGAWKKRYVPGKKYITIYKDDIKEEYEKLVKS